MLTKNQSKRILSLKQKKQRLKQGLFIVEGPKVVQEFIDSNYELVEIFSINNKIKYRIWFFDTRHPSPTCTHVKRFGFFLLYYYN